MKSLKRQFKILKSVKPDEIKREEFSKLIAEMSADYHAPSFSWRHPAVFFKSVPALALISALFLAASGTGITFASQNTLPGEALYPAKLAIEKIMVAAAGNVEKKTELRLKYAGRRLSEVGKMVEQKNKTGEKEVAAALEDYEKKLDDAQKVARIEKPDAPKAVSAVQESAKVYEKNIVELISRAEEKKFDGKVKERLERARERTKDKLKDSDKDENKDAKEDKEKIEEKVEEKSDAREKESKEKDSAKEKHGDRRNLEGGDD